MRLFRIRILGTFLLIACIGVVAGGCDNTTTFDQTPTNTQSCGTEVVHIGVGDGFLQTICGCQEAGSEGTVIQPPASFNCTVPAGIVLNFQYLGTQINHQILSTGTPSFVSSPLHEPNTFQDGRVVNYSVQLVEPGPYTFVDAYLPGVTGNIIVQ